MTTDLRNPFIGRIGRIGPKRALVAAGVVAAVAVPSGAVLASTADKPAETVDATAATLAGTAASTLSTAEQQGLEYMRQEEKLAGDVYATLHDAWGLQVFANIARAEQTHQRQVAATMALYGVDDPVDGLAAGEFVDPDLQALHDELVTRGMTTVEEALRAAALIEELDIADLRSRASETPDIDALYARLEQGSQNHLRAFVRNLERIGVDYEPEVLALDDYEAILADESTANRRGPGHGQGQGTGEGRGQGQGHRQGPGRGQVVDPGRQGGAGLQDGSGPALVHTS